nr:autotransporter outer membrane beta-barrel domain-containing protein [Marinicella sp. W31]MDC2877325.1 autotransporter outer membrane beta-barrel domain-containing protein [Marinicella sp. W31]
MATDSSAVIITSPSYAESSTNPIIYASNWEEITINGQSSATLVGTGLAIEGYQPEDSGNLFNPAYGDLVISENSKAIVKASQGDFTLSGNLHITDSESSFETGDARTTIQGHIVNNGLIDLRGNGTESSLSIETGSEMAAYTGIGGTIKLDVNMADGTHDTIRFNGKVAGNTRLVINAEGEPRSTTDGLLLIEAPAGSPSNAFTGSLTFGERKYEIIYRDRSSEGAANGYYLMSVS